MKQPKSYTGDLRSDLTGFRQKARAHQSDFRQNELKVDFSDAYGSRLIEADGFKKGLNFYNELGVRDTVHAKFKKYKEQLHSNLLRSEHIPYNFFVPIDHSKHEVTTVHFLNQLVQNLQATSITKVAVEYPLRKENPLGDSTSFDTYVETIDSGNLKTGIGIEVKYTEHSYAYGTTEKEKMFDPEAKSAYHEMTAYAGIDKAHVELLRQKDLKQFWRNYLLGVAMVSKGSIDKFISVHLYPEGNTYQAKHAEAFQALLPVDERFTFLPLTYEQFIKGAKAAWKDNDQMLEWVKYLERRYIVR